MSVHTYIAQKHADSHRIVMGYDRPTRSIFMTIWRLTPRANAPETPLPLYTHLDDVAFGGTTQHLSSPCQCQGAALDHFAEVIEHLGLSAPDSLYNEVWLDSMNNTGNRVVEHEGDSTFVELNTNSTLTGITPCQP